jgi:transaldolase
MTEIYIDSSEEKELLNYHRDDKITGFTTNPSLMKAAGVKDYKSFAKKITKKITNKPISFEVFSDDIDEMYEQGKKIADIASNIVVKIPITNSKGESTIKTINKLKEHNIKVNITAVFTKEQVYDLYINANITNDDIVSIFAGRISDTGVNPRYTMEYAIELLKNKGKILWASSRSVYDIYQCRDINCHIITITPSLYKKLKLEKKDLNEYSLETVKMFYDDAKQSGFEL